MTVNWLGTVFRNSFFRRYFCSSYVVVIAFILVLLKYCTINVILYHATPNVYVRYNYQEIIKRGSPSCWPNLISCARIFFCSKIAIFSQFQVYLNKPKSAERIINLLLLNNFCPAISYRRDRKESEGLVTRYGPQSVASATWLINRR